MMPGSISLQHPLATFAGWLNRQQSQAIEYLVDENRVLKEQLGGRRLRLTTNVGDSRPRHSGEDSLDK